MVCICLGHHMEFSELLREARNRILSHERSSGSQFRAGVRAPSSPGMEVLSVLPSSAWGVLLKVDSWSKMAARGPAIWSISQTGDRGKDRKSLVSGVPEILFDNFVYTSLARS